MGADEPRGIRVIGLDIDGTLLDGRGEVSAAARRELRRLHQQGTIIALVTGRRFRTAREAGAQIGVPVLYGVHNGAALRRSDGSYVYACCLQEAAVREACRVGRSAGAFAFVYQDDAATGETRIYCESPEGAAAAVGEYVRFYTRRNQQYVHLVEDLSREFCGPALEVMLTCAAALGDAVSDAVETALGARVRVIQEVSHGICHVEVAHPLVSKALPLERLAEEAGVGPEAVMAVGDNFNDLDMLRYAGYAVVMGNARPELLRMGFHVAPRNDEDGLAVLLGTVDT
jgi:Cof subfamily protein (haloacid dehalogenase superfamily)